MGMFAIFESLEQVEKDDPLIAPPITVSSSHTKHALEDLHPNIAVMRHPDHLPDQKAMAASIMNQFSNFKLTAASASSLPGDALKAIYGVSEDTVLYWAHHEKLCLVDGRIAFMGGLDLCYGRWDTNQHSIADAHPGDVSQIVFPGQDYNNSRVMDFQDVVHWENNKLSRTENSRMGWSDVALSLTGIAVEDLKEHFVQRWNFIFEEKYHSRPDPRYAPLTHLTNIGGYRLPGEEVDGDHVDLKDLEDMGHKFKEKLRAKIHDVEGHFTGENENEQRQEQPLQTGLDPVFGGSNISCQILRSAAKWSHGHALEVSSKQRKNSFFLEQNTR
jgi:phospholipase D1/2